MSPEGVRIEDARDDLECVIVQYAFDYGSYIRSTTWPEVQAALDAYRDALTREDG